MSLFMDVHTIEDGVSVEDVAGAHAADLQTQNKYQVSYLRYWVREEAGKIFCLVEADDGDDANTVHREAHGLVADEIYPVIERFECRWLHQQRPGPDRQHCGRNGRHDVGLPVRPPTLMERWWWSLIDFSADRAVGPELNTVRSELGLEPVSKVFDLWMVYPPDRTLGIFPDWFGPPQPDWPGSLHLTGFSLYDQSDQQPDNPDLQEWITQGAPPVVFVPGTANVQASSFFNAGLFVCQTLDLRAVFVTSNPDDIPSDLRQQSATRSTFHSVACFPGRAASSLKVESARVLSICFRDSPPGRPRELRPTRQRVTIRRPRCGRIDPDAQVPIRWTTGNTWPYGRYRSSVRSGLGSNSSWCHLG